MPKKPIMLDNRSLFLARLKGLRREAGLTQFDVGMRFNVSRGAYQRWETGDAEVPVGALPTLAEMYGVSIDYLLTGQGGAECISPPLYGGEPQEDIAVSRVWLEQFGAPLADIRLLLCPDEGVHPLHGIRKGDWAVLDISVQAYDAPAVYAVRLDGQAEPVLRGLERIRESVWVEGGPLGEASLLPAESVVVGLVVGRIGAS